ncbi:MAG: NAD(P)-binding domain-containing protein [Acidobacteriaceae bacterium]|nr:NAD(P)-binding domain-containing protein [Acidobacteriaceae bacterium]
MRIGIIGAGHIGSNCARRFVVSGKNEVMLSFSRHQGKLEAQAREIDEKSSAGTPQEAVQFGEVVVLSVPWDTIPEALQQAGSLAGKIIIDTTNQFGSVALPPRGQTAAEFNAARMPGARYTKSFNTLTSRFQAQTADRPKDQKVVQWICGDDGEAKRIVAGLIEDAGYVPVDLGGTKNCQVMEAPRRKGAVYGEEYRAADAFAVVEAVRHGRAIPPTPVYE